MQKRGMEMNFEASIKDLVKFVEGATCSLTTVETSADMLNKEGFLELELKADWTLEAGKKYFVNIYGSTLVAFTIGKDYKGGMLRIATAHTDSPGFCIKSKAEMKTGMGKFGKLNVEAYGGAILNTWMDRPLSIAVRAAVKSNNVFEPEIRIVDLKKPVVTIPNLAIHMNREINDGIKLNKQVDMLPIGCQMDEKTPSDFFVEYLAKELKVKKEDILDYEGYVYNAEKGEIVGFNDEFLVCPRIDNETSVLACLKAIIDSGKNNYNNEGINLIAVFDNEEVGSSTKQGAGSNVLSFVIEKIISSLNRNNDVRKDFINTVLNAMMLSVDVAHATHPNHPEKNDPTNEIILNAGPVIKRSGAQKYATDAKAVGIVEQLCQNAYIPYQKFANRSDMLGGSTLGPISDTNLPMLTVDIGVPILAMHSAKETMGVKDQAYMEALLCEFFKA